MHFSIYFFFNHALFDRNVHCIIRPSNYFSSSLEFPVRSFTFTLATQLFFFTCQPKISYHAYHHISLENRVGRCASCLNDGSKMSRTSRFHLLIDIDILLSDC